MKHIGTRISRVRNNSVKYLTSFMNEIVKLFSYVSYWRIFFRHIFMSCYIFSIKVLYNIKLYAPFHKTHSKFVVFSLSMLLCERYYTLFIPHMPYRRVHSSPKYGERCKRIFTNFPENSWQHFTWSTLYRYSARFLIPYKVEIRSKTTYAHIRFLLPFECYRFIL